MIKNTSRSLIKILAAGGLAAALSFAGVSLASAHKSSSDPSSSGPDGRDNSNYDQSYDPGGSGQGNWQDQGSLDEQGSPYDSSYDQSNQNLLGGHWRHNQDDSSVVDPGTDQTNPSQDDPTMMPDQNGSGRHGSHWDSTNQSGSTNVFMGKVDSVSGSTLTIKDQKGTYQVNATDATVINRSGKSISPSDIRSGDRVIIQGDGNGGSGDMNAQFVFDLTLS